MREFVITLLCAGVSSGVIGLFFEDDAEIMKYIKVVLSLCIAASIIPSVFGMLGKLPLEDILPEEDGVVLEEFQQRYDNYVIENARKELAIKLKREIFEKTGINVPSCNIQFSVEEKEEKLYVDIASVEIEIDSDTHKNSVSECVYSLVGIYPEFSSASKMEDEV